MIRRFSPPAPAGPHCRHKRLHRRLAGCERNEGPEGLQGHIADRREASSPATEWRARLRPRWVSGGGNPTPTAHPPQCYGRGRLVGFRGDRLCLVPLSCASEGGGPWGPSAAPDACVPERGYLRGWPVAKRSGRNEGPKGLQGHVPDQREGCPLRPLFGSFLADQKGTPRRAGESD